MAHTEESRYKSERVLELLFRFQSGETVRKEQLAKEYGVTPRSIQRDIDSIRRFYAERMTEGGEIAEIKYDRIQKGFRLVNSRMVTLTNQELFAITKILLESRSLNRKEMTSIIQKLLEACLPPTEQKKMRELISNELFHYVEPHHKKALVEVLWELGSAVYGHKLVQLSYRKTNGEITNAVVKPVGIMCSEFYFYLIAYIGDADKTHVGYPTIYRIDRIKKYQIEEKRFQIPYANRFEEGEFRKRIPFMYGGPLRKEKFIYKGSDIDAVLDRLPTAEAARNDDGSWTVSVEVYGNIGLEMWLRSQGEYVK